MTESDKDIGEVKGRLAIVEDIVRLHSTTYPEVANCLGRFEERLRAGDNQFLEINKKLDALLASKDPCLACDTKKAFPLLKWQIRGLIGGLGVISWKIFDEWWAKR